MTEQHPITPPPELVQQWITEGRYQDYCSATEHATARAARWGSDQELEACCEWLSEHNWRSVEPALRAARRPKPPSIKKQAFALLDVVEISNNPCNSWDFSIIRRALEQLDD